MGLEMQVETSANASSPEDSGRIIEKRAVVQDAQQALLEIGLASPWIDEMAVIHWPQR
jgi:hypothetical protein